MAETDQTKVCPLCAESIKAQARVCPYCRKYQRRGFFISRFELYGIGTGFCLLVIFLLAVNLSLSSRSFASSRGKIVILDSRFSLSLSEGYTNVVVSGVLTNSSDYAWENLGFEVRFFDADGKIVDATSSGEGDFTVLSHSDHSFYAFLGGSSIPVHSRYSILVSSASDPKYWFTLD